MNVQYDFWVYNPAAAPGTPLWTELQSMSPASSCSWTPLTAGGYMLSVTAQDGLTGTQIYTTQWYTVLGTAPLTAVKVGLSPISPQAPGTTITISATPVGGANVTYQFWVYNPVATPAWTQLQGYSALTSCTWTPNTVGSYMLAVTGKDGATGQEVTTLSWYTIMLAPLLGVSLQASPASPQPAGTQVTFTATANGGTNVQYQFWVFDPTIQAPADGWTMVQGFSTTNTCPWTPSKAGSFLITVNALDGASTTQVTNTLWYVAQ